jgi:hypothetical protein
MVWAMLVDQLGRTLRAIGDAHGARREVEMAKVLVDRLSAPPWLLAGLYGAPVSIEAGQHHSY